jgi:hypothetical protein
MNIEPIRRYSQPRLPTREIVDEHPELLRLLPKRWQTNSAVVAALTACLAMTTCNSGQAADTPTKVAPVFEHGTGIGSFGCIAVNPPIFLSEDEARQVIVEEAKRSRIQFAPDGKTLDDITLITNGTFDPVKDAEGKWQYHTKYGTQVRSISLDGFDKKRNIAFEYVSEKDLKDWNAGVTVRGTAGDDDLIGVAKSLSAGIAKAKPGGTYGVFYDPAIGYKDALDKAGKLDYSSPDSQARLAKIDAAASQLAREDLRKQVQDFIKWLKAQGVI